MSEQPNLLLSDAERQRFIQWLTHEIFTTRGIIAQMERIDSPAFLIQAFRNEIAAHEFVRDKLAKTESASLEGPR